MQPIGVAGGEGRNVRKLGEETGIVALHGLDARLLEHDLGEPDVIGFAVTPPGQVAFVLFIPAEQRREKIRRECHDEIFLFAFGRSMRADEGIGPYRVHRIFYIVRIAAVLVK